MMENSLKKIDIYNWITLLYTWNQTPEPDMEQLSGLKLVKKYGKAIYCHLAYLTYMQSACAC